MYHLKILLKHMSNTKAFLGIQTNFQKKFQEKPALSFQVLSIFNEGQIFNNTRNS